MSKIAWEMTRDEFIEKANEKHGGKYEYSLVPDNVTCNDKIQVICNEMHPWREPHGVFIVQAGKHVSRGDGCPKCSGKHKRTKDDFVKEATYVHNGLYTYDDFVWVNSRTKGKIHCTKHDIDFEMSPCHHLSGQGCPKCRYEKASASKTKSFKEFEDEANIIHGNKYRYAVETYVNRREKTKITCPIHGEFWQSPQNHLRGQGCPGCGRAQCDKSRAMTFEEFVDKANGIHGSRYEYDKETYVSASNMVRIYCKEHGWFCQKGVNHISLNQGCPKCSNQQSMAEEEIFDFIKKELGISDIENRNRELIKPYELDLYIPSRKIAIEYDGLAWHSSKFNKARYHLLNKTNICDEHGIRLIHIFEDEWFFSREKVKSRLSSILGGITTRIYARKCLISEVDPKASRSFLGRNHIQGFCKARYHYGLYYGNELVSLMTFGRVRQMKGRIPDYETTYELLRFCNKTGINVVGGASKLLKHFMDEVKPKSIISYADKRWSDGNLYYKLGFTHVHDSKPNYFYVIGKHRENRFKYRKSELVKQGFDPSKSEKEIMEERKIPRIYDCGCMCFKLNT